MVVSGNSMQGFSGLENQGSIGSVEQEFSRKIKAQRIIILMFLFSISEDIFQRQIFYFTVFLKCWNI